MSTNTSKNLITIHFDGGCRPTNPGNKYGSYQVHLNGSTHLEPVTLEFGWGTNNEAEFESLEAGLIHANQVMELAGLHPRDFDVQLFTDSTIVRNRINGRNRTKKSEPEQRMYNLAARCLKHLILFKSYAIHWHPRIANVERFGH